MYRHPQSAPNFSFRFVGTPVSVKFNFLATIQPYLEAAESFSLRTAITLDFN
jgi:hypothetical protein